MMRSQGEQDIKIDAKVHDGLTHAHNHVYPPQIKS